MKVKTKKYGLVDVVCKDCPKYECFVPHHWQHLSRTIDGKNSGYSDNYYSCAVRNYNGCPETPIKKENN